MLEVYLKTKPKAEVYAARFSRENFSRAALEELIEAKSLFGEKLVVRGEDLIANFGPEIAELLPRLAESPTKFVLIEEELAVPLAKKITKLGGKILEACLAVGQAKSPKLKAGFNPFALSDALGARDRKKLWVLYQRALLAGFPAEEIFWKFQWQIKNLLLAKAGEENLRGLNPFVASKARAAAKNYETAELQNLSRGLVTMLSLSRRGESDLEIALERLILGL